MIGNNYLNSLYAYPDLDTSINQLLELLSTKDKRFLESLNVPLDINALEDDERHYLTIVSAIIDYHLQLYKMDVPSWLRSEALCFDKPYFHSKRISDFDRVKLQYTVPGPFRRRNVYMDPDGMKRI